MGGVGATKEDLEQRDKVASADAANSVTGKRVSDYPSGIHDSARMGLRMSEGSTISALTAAMSSPRASLSSAAGPPEPISPLPESAAAVGSGDDERRTSISMGGSGAAEARGGLLALRAQGGPRRALGALDTMQVWCLSVRVARAYWMFGVSWGRGWCFCCMVGAAF